MTTKLKKLNLKGKSDQTIAKDTAAWKKVVSGDADKIDAAKKAIDTAKDKIDAASDYLNKANGYQTQSQAYDALESQIEDQEKALAKTKSSSKKKSIESKIKDLKKQKAAVAETMKKIASSAGYNKEMNAKTKAEANIKTEKKKISDLTTKKSKDSKKYSAYAKEKAARNAAKVKKQQKANSAKIKKTIAAAKKAGRINDHTYMGGQTAVYRADLKTSRVYLLGEVDPSETNDQDVPVYAVDKGDTRTNYSVRSSKQLSGTYYLFGNSLEDCDTAYEILQGWARKGVEVVVQGFAKWAHCYLSSVGKTGYPAGNKRSMQLSITFTYSMKAKIAYAKKKTKKKAKSSTTKSSGTKKTTKKTITIKSGMTYWYVSQKTGVSVSTLEKLNKWPATAIPVGAKVRYQ